MLQLYGQALVSGLITGGIYALVASGFTLIFGVMHLGNFAHGPLMVLAMYLVYVLYTGLHVDPYLTLLVTVPLFYLLGVGLYSGLFRRVLHANEHIQLVLSIGLWFFIENLALLLFGGDLKMVQPAYAGNNLRLAGLVVSVPKLASFLIAVVAAAALRLFLQHTDFGRAIRACAQNAATAPLMGINLNRVHAAAFGIGLALAAVAATVITPFRIITPFIGMDFTLRAFVIVIIGGLGSVSGAVLAALLVGVLEALGTVLLSPSWATALLFGALILVLAVRPFGLFGSSSN